MPPIQDATRWTHHADLGGPDTWDQRGDKSRADLISLNQAHARLLAERAGVDPQSLEFTLVRSEWPNPKVYLKAQGTQPRKDDAA